METKIKEEAKDASLCFDTASQDGSASLSFVEQYARYLRGNSPEIDSDCDFLPDETMLRNEYIQLTNGNTSFPRAKNHRLSTGLPTGKHRSANHTNRTLSDETIDVVSNNNNNNNDNENDIGQSDGTTTTLEHKSNDAPQRDLDRLDELIEKLAEVRRTGPEGNSIFCTTEELDAIQERYSAILDYLEEKTAIFERRSNSKESENEEQVDVGQIAPEDQRESMRMLQEKIQSVQQVRDRLNELRSQVKDQIEQLEIFERTKMENVS